MQQTGSLDTRVAAAIGGLSDPTLKAGFVDGILENLRGIERQITGLLKVTLLAMVVFELVSRASVPEVDVGPVKVTDLSLVQKCLPALIAYFYNQLVALFSMRIQLLRIHREAVKNLAKPIYDNDLEDYVVPYSWFNTEDIFTQFTGSAFFANITMPIKFLIVALPIAFLLYAYCRCFAAFGIYDVLLWLSVALSTLLAVQGVMFFASQQK